MDRNSVPTLSFRYPVFFLHKETKLRERKVGQGHAAAKWAAGRTLGRDGSLASRASPQGCHELCHNELLRSVGALFLRWDLISWLSPGAV